MILQTIHRYLVVSCKLHRARYEHEGLYPSYPNLELLLAIMLLQSGAV